MKAAEILKQAGYVPVISELSRNDWDAQTPATLDAPRVPVIPDENKTRNRLWSLAEVLHVDVALVNGISDLDECASQPDNVLCAYLKALQATADREAGRLPESYCHTATCRGCGPVWLFVSGTVVGCPWCWNRVRGLHIPRPITKTCGTCRHFQRKNHPHLGACALGVPGAPAGHWDSDTTGCGRWMPVNTGQNQS